MYNEPAWGLLSAMVDDVGALWSLLLWRYSSPTWPRCCAACSGWPCFGRGFDWVTHRGLCQHRTFCDSVGSLGISQQKNNLSPRQFLL